MRATSTPAVISTRHAHGFKPRPQSAFGGDAAIRTRDAADARIGEGQGHGAQVDRRDAHIAVADDEDVVGGSFFHQFHGADLGVDVGRLAGGEEFCGNLRITSGDATRDREARVVRSARAEEDFVFGIVLLEEGGEMFFEIRLGAVQRLEQGQRGRESREVVELRVCRPPLAQVSRHGPQDHAGEHAGSDQAEGGQCEQGVEHAGFRIRAGNTS